MIVLFVCTANIHRSALAEAMLASALRAAGRSDLRAASAGTIALQGLPASREASELARRRGLDLSGHRSRPLRRPHLLEAARVLVMESAHLSHVGSLAPEALPRTCLLSAYAPPGCRIRPGGDVPDAFDGDEEGLLRSHEVLRDCVDRLWSELSCRTMEAYVAAVESRLQARVGGGLSLSPADWSLLDAWWSDGVPLWIVLDCLEETIARTERRGDSGRMRRLSYCAPLVHERREAWRRSMVGEPPVRREEESPLGAAAQRLRDAAQALSGTGQAQAARAVEKALLEVEAMPRDEGPALQRLRLLELEDDLGTALRAAAGPHALASLSRMAEGELQPHAGRMTPEALQRTLALLVDRRLRDHYGIPPLAPE
ncbi:MAG TPA: hypothetical protein VJV23_01010 [Candidatus Polarisedimenticolia bacterium]|nr:hypothetical protein [Candidatus Polarisedimenticolia bacterium]